MKCLVLYMYQGISETIIKNSCCSFKHNPPTMKDVKELTEKIQTETGIGGDIVVINWLPLSDDEEDTT